MGSSVPNTKTRPSTPSNTTVQSLQKRLEGLENQIARLNANRTPAPTLLHELANALPMSQVQDGQGLVYSAASGQYEPGQNFRFVLANVVTDFSAPNAQFFVVSPSFDSYEIQMSLNAGASSPTTGQAIFEVFTIKAASNAEISIGVDSGPSIGRFWADTISLGSTAGTLTGNPVPGAGIMGFFGEGGNNRQTITGAKGGNTALTSLLAALVSYGLVVDTSGP
jgi:hypothetical protein